jgi:hypothetical protein
MKRFAIVALLVIAGSVVAVAAATSPKAQLRAFVCQTARDPAGRGISITAVMRPLPGTTRMALRFDLLVRQPHSSQQQAVHYGDLGTWIYPKDKTLGRLPGDRWIVNHPVAQLTTAPAYYRFRVSFRWTGPHGRVLGTTVRRSPTCFQPELRPDLDVSAVNVSSDPGHPNRDAYSAVVRNLGASSTLHSFKLQFSEGTTTKTQTVAAMKPHSKTVVTLTGPVCDASAPPTVTVDPGGVIDDYNRSNNSLVVNCPAP